jgi:cytochrome c553
MKKTLKIVLIVLVVAFAAIQFYRPDTTAPAIVQAETLEASANVPENVNQILTRSCNDCHTNKTIYPWYSQIVPASIFLADHISEGRQELNFSVWNTYETNRKRRKLDQICEQVTEKEMPLPSYLWIHRDAKLSDEDIKTLCDWANGERARLAESK